MLEIRLLIDENDADDIQASAYEYEGQKKIIKEIILDNAESPAVLEGKAFKRYNEMYQDTAATFEREKAKIEMKYIPAELRLLGADTSWNLSYADREMVITVKSDKFDKTWESITFSEAARDVEVRVIENVAPICKCNCR